MKSKTTKATKESKKATLMLDHYENKSFVFKALIEALQKFRRDMDSKLIWLEFERELNLDESKQIVRFMIKEIKDKRKYVYNLIKEYDEFFH